jgi:hypothetical protein
VGLGAPGRLGIALLGQSCRLLALIRLRCGESFFVERLYGRVAGAIESHIKPSSGRRSTPIPS